MSGHFAKRLKATRAERRLSARLERHHPTMLILHAAKRGRVVGGLLYPADSDCLDSLSPEMRPGAATLEGGGSMPAGHPEPRKSKFDSRGQSFGKFT
jgi:hypothetical protein